MKTIRHMLVLTVTILAASAGAWAQTASADGYDPPTYSTGFPVQPLLVILGMAAFVAYPALKNAKRQHQDVN